jgi:hypothetical protein
VDSSGLFHPFLCRRKRICLGEFVGLDGKTLGLEEKRENVGQRVTVNTRQTFLYLCTVNAL